MMMSFRMSYRDYLRTGLCTLSLSYPGTSPISMTPHRMAPVELQELKVQL